MDSSGLQHAMQVTIEYLDLLMVREPTREIADASNTLEALLAELKARQ